MIHARLTLLMAGLVTDAQFESDDGYLSNSVPVVLDDFAVDDLVFFANYRAVLQTRCRSLLATLHMSEFRWTVKLAIEEGQFVNLPPDAFDECDVDDFEDDPLFDHHYAKWLAITYPSRPV